MPVDLHYEHGRKVNRWSKKKKMTNPQIPTPDHTPDSELLEAGAVTLPPAAVPSSKPTSPPPSAPPPTATFGAVQSEAPAPAAVTLMIGMEELTNMIELKEAMVDRAQMYYQQALTSLQNEQSGLAALRAVKDRNKSGSVVFRLDA